MSGWFLDACSLINLYASGRLGVLAARQGRPFLLVPTVVAEAGWVYGRNGAERAERVPIDLEPLKARRQVEVVRPTAAMTAHFLRLAADLDDGEAMTIAAALETEGAGVVTDDEAALNYLGALGRCPVSTSLALLREDLAGAPHETCREVVLNLRICARYVPSLRHPDIDWWRQQA